MKILFLIITLVALKKSSAQTQNEFVIMKSVIIDKFSQWKDTVFYKTGKIKEVRNRTRRQSIIIKNTTVPNTLDLDVSTSTYHNFKQNIFNSLDSSTYIDFLSKKNIVSKIPSFDIPETEIQIKYIDTVMLNNIFKKGGWEKFNKTYSISTDLVEISRVGFNKDSTQALIYYSRSNCNLCGSGYLCLYEFRNGKWTFVDSYMEWIS